MDPGEKPPGPSSADPILVASTGEPFDRQVLERAMEIARENGSSTIRVFSTARVYGTALGLQHPGLLPSKQEWQAQVDLVADAVRILKRAGFDARARVVGTRSPSKAITNEAVSTRCRAIVIGGRPVARWQTLLRQDEVGLLTRRTTVPVHIVDLPAPVRAAR